ncbi:MAG: hypothetical protein J6V72_20475 [Kiritimatiellae bacterium]|nr:hypothetical protein [Kiritimatiellia bacterium]
MKKIAIWASVIAVSAILPARGDTYTVNAGDTQTLDSVTNTTRFTKSGAGTLVVTGTNSLTSLTSSGGTLIFRGGETTISGSGSSGAYGDAAFVNTADEFIIDGGATVKITGGAYGHTDNGIMLVTNGTFDASSGITSGFMNGFTGAFPSARVVINDGGVVRAKVIRVVGAEAATEAVKENFSIDLNAGGALYADTFWEDNGSRYGRINFNGGVLHPTKAASDNSQSHIFYEGDKNITWTQSMVTPTVLEGGCYIQLTANNYVYPAFMSGVGEGETDGGLHVLGNSVLYWRAKNSTYNGGTWLEGSGIFALNGSFGDTSLGALPATPATNIWIMSGHTLFSEGGTMNIHSNRMIFVKSGKTFYTGSQGRLIIGGEIKAEPSPGLDYSTNNLFQVRGDWAGTVVIGPGEGITNNLGRVYVGACLEVTNGVFRLGVGGQKMGGHSLVEILNVTGNGSSFSNTKGHLKLTAGELYSTQGNYSEVSNYGHIEVVGGKLNVPNSNFLTGLTGPAKISVSNNGEFVVGTFRLGQGASNPNTINLGKGGVIRSKELTLEFNNNQDVTFNFDGGRFQSNAGDDSYGSLFYASSNAKWDGVNFYVREGGAVLDSSFGKHVWWAHPLVSGAERDGGLTCLLGNNKDVVLCGKAQCSYNGPTRTVFTTGANTGTLQCRVANALPATTTLQIGFHTQVGFNGSWSSGNDLDQTVARVEGVGQVAYCSKLVVTNGISAVFDGEYGTLTFGNSCSLAGTYDIVGNTNGCGCVKFKSPQDVSNLSLRFANVETMDQHARSSFYKIVEAPNGITGTFSLAADWPRGWAVKYASDRKSVYVYYQNGTRLVVR